MTMRADKKYKIGDAGAVYEFDVKMHHLRGVDISDEELADEIDIELGQYARQLKTRYKWISEIYLTGRSGGWLAIVDKTGGARKTTLKTIHDRLEEEVERFQEFLKDSYGRSK